MTSGAALPFFKIRHSENTDTLSLIKVTAFTCIGRTASVLRFQSQALQSKVHYRLPCWSLVFQWFTEESDELWMRHCQRDFKRESPQEYESWREMYLRLHDEREERLRLLTQNISSAHANKPKGRRRRTAWRSGWPSSQAAVTEATAFVPPAGRQVKMAFVNSVAKPPRDVRRRQEKFGTTSGLSTVASTAAAAPIKSVLSCWCPSLYSRVHLGDRKYI